MTAGANCSGDDKFPTLMRGSFTRLIHPARDAKPQWAAIADLRRIELGLSLDALIPVFGCKTRGAVGHYFSGRREPSVQQLLDLAKTLELPIGEMLGELPRAGSRNSAALGVPPSSGLPAWLLRHPRAKEALPHAEAIIRVVDAYLLTSDAGRDNLRAASVVAELLAGYGRSDGGIGAGEGQG